MTVHHTAAELKELKGTIDWDRVNATTEDEIEQQAIEDGTADLDWSKVGVTASHRAPRRITFEQVPGSVAVAYVGYREPFGGGITTRISSDVNVDMDAAGDVIGIEIIGVDEASLVVAAQFAKEHNLEFPRDLSGCIAA